MAVILRQTHTGSKSCSRRKKLDFFFFNAANNQKSESVIIPAPPTIGKKVEMTFRNKADSGEMAAGLSLISVN